MTLVLEVFAQNMWVPAINNWGGAGRWAFLEVTDPWDAEHLISEKHLAPTAQTVS
jgi:hypothetical protein